MWYYVPSKSSTPAPEAECLENQSLPDSTPLESSVALCVTLNGKPQARPLSWNGWRRRPWVKRLYGTICNHSMAKRGVDAWILLVRDCHVSLTAAMRPTRRQRRRAIIRRRWRRTHPRHAPNHRRVFARRGFPRKRLSLGYGGTLPISWRGALPNGLPHRAAALPLCGRCWRSA